MVRRLASAIALAAACSPGGGDDVDPLLPDAVPACRSPNPGCSGIDVCPGSCGDIVYGCVGDEWVPMRHCGECPGLSPIIPGTWRFTHARDPASACFPTIPTEVVLFADVPVDDNFVSVIPEDPNITINRSYGSLGTRDGACFRTVQVNAYVPVTIDTLHAAVSFNWYLDFFAPGEPDALSGRFSGYVDAWCVFHGTVSGSLELDP